ncbi:AfsR/SARP family transcriptional regulator [Natronincola ferrireducens]|uniref:DNA-binding transcriptional activator of the SARP family n=1 Tax=Natronincola ferrireducens TaxID=393762 RepID=A0A1G8XDK3_9FIRM|nr:BTAD domain-containing putative transcriptional regulator [Natronincola ferrireducens]SDJ88642.1 DNA-binding transcriptional activator of the SARP family [Natronincola ferrireducens]
MLKLYFLGEPKILVGDIDITNEISSKALAILAYLVTHRNQKISRDRISALFWSESSYKSSKYNLRYTLWSIKKTLKDKGIEEDIILAPDKESCSIIIEEESWWSDVVLLEKFPDVYKSVEIIDLYQGEFLQDINLKGNPELDDWIIYERERLQKLYFNGLLRLTKEFSELGQYNKGILCLNKLLYINPLQEEIHKELMELYYLKGDRVLALQQYEKCAEILRSELNISPVEDMRELYERIKMGDKEDITIRNNKDLYKNPNYFVLAEIIETIIEIYPDILEDLTEGQLWELAKLVPELSVASNGPPIEYKCQEIEKLRIFKAAASLIKNAEARGGLPHVKAMGEMDKVSIQFIAYMKMKFPNITIPVEII